MDMFDFAGMLFGRAGTTQARSVTASGAAASDDGVASITLDADVTPAEDVGEDADQTVIDLPTSPDVDEGDELIVTLVGDGPLKTPVVTANPGSGDRMRAAVTSARSVADAAQAVANAVNQHFFADTNGIHVTEATQEDWNTDHSGANVLINSIGQLFRDGLNNLLTLTTENGARALTIWDGLGNTAANVLATFSANGISFADGTSFDIGDSSAYINFDGNGHISIGGSGLTIGGYIPTGGVTVSDLTQAAQDATLNSNMSGDIYQSAQPNLTPFFEIAPNDATYWFATGNLKTKTTPLGDGWSHVEYSSLNLNVSPRIGVLNLAPSTKYTVMLEVRNATALTNCKFYLYTDTNSMWAASVNAAVSENGTYYLTGQTKADLTDSAITHLRIFVGHNSSVVNADIRLSLYEGEYDGPFKPYSGTRLFATQTDASNAAKTATSYVTEITGQNGIMVHPSTDDDTGVRITSDVDIMRDGNSVLNVGTQGDTTSTDAGVTIYDGTASKNVVASFDSDEVSLGANSNSSTIDMCGGAFKFSVDKSDPNNVIGLIKVDQNAIDDHTANTPTIQILSGTSSDGRGIEILGTPGAQYPVSVVSYGSGTMTSNVGLGSLGVLTPGVNFGSASGLVEAYGGLYVQSLTGTNFWSTVPGTILWSGSYYMTSSHIANLTYNVSTCPTGVVLHFQPYTSSTTQNYYHQYCFVPKTTVTASAGAVHNFTLCNSGFANVGMKALRIYDNRIEGIDTNDDTGTASGITFNNKYWVMTQVIAV